MALQNGHRAINSDSDIGAGLLWYAQAMQTKGKQAAVARHSARSLIGGWGPSQPWRWMEHHNDVKAVSFSPDNMTIATAGIDKTARLWNAATGQPRGMPLKHSATVTGLSFSADGQTLPLRVKT